MVKIFSTSFFKLDNSSSSYPDEAKSLKVLHLLVQRQKDVSRLLRHMDFRAPLVFGIGCSGSFNIMNHEGIRGVTDCNPSSITLFVPKSLAKNYYPEGLPCLGFSKVLAFLSTLKIHFCQYPVFHAFSKYKIYKAERSILFF